MKKKKRQKTRKPPPTNEGTWVKYRCTQHLVRSKHDRDHGGVCGGWKDWCPIRGRVVRVGFLEEVVKDGPLEDG